MAIDQTRFVRDGFYTPYHSIGRGVGNGLVGTLQIDAEATGAAGGGIVVIRLKMKREEFGFPLIFIPTYVAVKDNLATAELVTLDYRAAGNRRMSSNVSEMITTLQNNNENAGLTTNTTIPIEGGDRTEQDIMTAVWETNTDTKTYHLHMFGPVFDLQVIARSGLVDPLLAGLR